jgi:hypothetical protein
MEMKQVTVDAGQLIERVVNADRTRDEPPNLWVLVVVPVVKGEPVGCHFASNYPDPAIMQEALREAADMIERRKQDKAIHTEFYPQQKDN